MGRVPLQHKTGAKGTPSHASDIGTPEDKRGFRSVPFFLFVMLARADADILPQFSVHAALNAWTRSFAS